MEQVLERPRETSELTPRTRVFLLALRQVLIMALGAVEDYLALPRSIIPRHRRC